MQQSNSKRRHIIHYIGNTVDIMELNETTYIEDESYQRTGRLRASLDDSWRSTTQHREVLRSAAIPLLIVVCIVLYLEPRRNSILLSTGGGGGTCVEQQDIWKLKPLSTVQDVEHGAVASDHSVCSEIGVKIMRDDGGNAVDAAVATALCLGVANPASSGIGGGAFILIHSDLSGHVKKTSAPHYQSPHFIDARDSDDLNLERGDAKVTEVIDCRETAPAAATTNMFLGLLKNASVVGGLAVAVPGELRGLELAHSRHGILSWAEVVEPSAQLALKGVPVGAHLAKDISQHVNKGNVKSILTRNNDMKTPLKENEILRQPELGETLLAIMEQGADAMYKGPRGKQIANDVQQAGGILTTDDLDNYRATLRSPLIAHDVSGFTLVGVPPPSSGGGTVIGAARFLSGYLSPFASFADTLSKHRMVEALRHAFAIRMSLSDPAFHTNVVTDAVNDLVHGPYMEQLRKISRDNDTLPLSMYGGPKWAQLNDSDDKGIGSDAHEGDRRRRSLARRFGYLDDHGTSHLTIIDKDRNAVSITSSINTIFGSGVLSESSGVILNSQMDDFGTPGRPDYFGLRPSPANYIKPGKKPLSSMSPILVFRKDGNATDSRMGKIFVGLGASGGPKIISAVLQVFLNYAFVGMDLFASMASPRLHDQLLYHESATTLYEESQLDHGQTIEVSKRTRDALKKRGHRLHSVDYTGCVQSIAVDLETNILTATSDIRKGGMPNGY